ncbi:transcriptional regulator with XRE-family HTH domain [Bradyrhizobium elkanii]|uniref:helix-turn-helix domain-containing protein n=1 Tax=Bradyrhizobium TaxID=374 RepID=UPI002169641E|nr:MULTISPECIES: helix-turn-helix transcriptional regulator [Bradyrhizobium]MCS3928984.1 transcriptional regulator with XRE-family HTH domain [Bradyrhizobium elkanii]MCS3969540.1 transcriptional regulator with XRE-family HTH domain [Bradyrhizobium japonicum]
MREHRLRKSWTQYDLADETRLRQALVSEIEAGKANPTLLSLHKIASALGVHVAELVLPLDAVLAQATKPAARGRGKPAKKRRRRPLKQPSR